MPSADIARILRFETEAMLERLGEIRPFALTLPMVAAAAPSVAAQAAIESYLSRNRRELRSILQGFVRWLESSQGRATRPDQAQQRFAAMRLRFLTTVSQFEIFADALAERSQHGYGDLIGGLDVAASEALDLPGNFYDAPPVICHLEGSLGAAIRRARTRLPGGGLTPVAMIRIPRERLVGSGIASSLVHEVGHQGADLLDLVGPVQDALKSRAARGGSAAPAWRCFASWISEILADYWSVARVGVASTIGLMGVVALPRHFVVQMVDSDPHPTPWIRVKISAAIGRSLFPDPQWDRIEHAWEELYPIDSRLPGPAAFFRLVESQIPAFVEAVGAFRPKRLGGARLRDAFPLKDRTPGTLRAQWREHQRRDTALSDLSPTRAFAVIGQARFDGILPARHEAALLRRLLRYWALRSTTDSSEVCAAARKPRSLALAS